LPTITKRPRTRVTKQAIERERQRILAEQAEKNRLRSRQNSEPSKEEPPKRGKWRQLSGGTDVFCDTYGWCWGINEKCQMICLGRTEDIFSKAKNHKPSLKKNRMCHLALKNDASAVYYTPSKIVCATFLKDPSFLASLDALISRGLGTWLIQRELEKLGYSVPYRTLSRWINKRKKKGEKDLIIKGSPEERAEQRQQIMTALSIARKRANTARLRVKEAPGLGRKSSPKGSRRSSLSNRHDKQGGEVRNV